MIKLVEKYLALRIAQIRADIAAQQIETAQARKLSGLLAELAPAARTVLQTVQADLARKAAPTTSTTKEIMACALNHIATLEVRGAIEELRHIAGVAGLAGWPSPAAPKTDAPAPAG